MKKLILILILLLIVVNITGCKPKEKEINGVVCKMYGYSWVPIANFCINCGEYQLTKYCIYCGTKQSLVVGRTKCKKCGRLSYSESYCVIDGNKNILVLIERQL